MDIFALLWTVILIGIAVSSAAKSQRKARAAQQQHPELPDETPVAPTSAPSRAPHDPRRAHTLQPRDPQRPHPSQPRHAESQPQKSQPAPHPRQATKNRPRPVLFPGDLAELLGSLTGAATNESPADPAPRQAPATRNVSPAPEPQSQHNVSPATNPTAEESTAEHSESFELRRAIIESEILQPKFKEF